MMNYLRNIVMVLCIGLLAVPVVSLLPRHAATGRPDQRGGGGGESAQVLHRSGSGGPERQEAALLQRCAQGPRGADQLYFHQLSGRLPDGDPQAHAGAQHAGSGHQRRRLVHLRQRRPGARHARGHEGVRRETGCGSRAAGLFLTGSKENLTYIVKQLGQYTQEVEAHSTLMLAGNDRTRHWTRVMPMVPPEGVAQQLRALAEEKTPG